MGLQFCNQIKVGTTFFVEGYLLVDGVLLFDALKAILIRRPRYKYIMTFSYFARIARNVLRK